MSNTPPLCCPIVVIGNQVYALYQIDLDSTFDWRQPRTQAREPLVCDVMTCQELHEQASGRRRVPIEKYMAKIGAVAGLGYSA